MRSGSLDVAGKLTDDAADADAIIPLKLTASLILRVASQRGVRAQREGEANSHDRQIPGAICLLDKGGARFQRGASRSLFNPSNQRFARPSRGPHKDEKICAIADVRCCEDDPTTAGHAGDIVGVERSVREDKRQ